MTRYTEADLKGFIARGMVPQAIADTLAPPDPDSAECFELRERPAKGRGHPEQDLQREVCQVWALQYPDSWQYTFHVPNELRSANRRLAGIFSALGVKSGVPDLLCLQRRGAFTGAALELKSETGQVSEKQSTWHGLLRSQGYYVGVAYNLEDALAFMHDYHVHRPP